MQQLSVDLLTRSGAYVGPPVKKEISWVSPDGKKHGAFIFVKLSSYETSMNEFETQRTGGDVLVSRIVSSVVDEAGKPVFTLENVQGKADGSGKLCSSLFLALLSAINEANGYTNEEETKN